MTPAERALLAVDAANGLREFREPSAWSAHGELAFDPLGILRTLVARGARFVLIGGFAANLRGTADRHPGPRRLLREGSPTTSKRWQRRCVSSGQAPSRPRARRRPAVHARCRRAAQRRLVHIRHVQGRLRHPRHAIGHAGFDDLDAGAETFVAAEGLSIRVASIDDLIRMKHASARTKDLVHLEHLEALREEIEQARARGLDPQQGTPMGEHERLGRHGGHW